MRPAACEPLPSSEIEALVDVLGEVARISYAPPNVYPMSAPAFDPVADLERGPPPPGPLGVYAHVPFCNYKCTFCFYATRSVPDAAEMGRYVAALERELAAIPAGTPLTQVYVGGGTPTALPPALLDRLLAATFSRGTPGDEVSTVECSPESVTVEHVEVLRRHGIERSSMGVQTNDPGVLAATHRRHAARQVDEACARLVGGGLLVNVDLIYGLPGQSADAFRADFAAIARLGVHSITAYNLRVNERTPIGRLLTEEERLDAVRLARWRELVRRTAEEHGFEQTRWHTFRRREPATAHDAWRRFRDVTGRGNQYGVGQSARSRLADRVYKNHSIYGAYVERVEGGRSPVEETRRLDDVDRRLRHVALTIGDGSPLSRAEYQAAFGTALDDDFGGVVARLVEAGLVADSRSRLELTATGALFYDLVMRAFYPQPVRRWMDERQRLSPAARPAR